MKNLSLYTVLLAVTFMTFTACGESEAEKQAKLQAKLDSARIAEQQKIAEMMQAYEDSVNAANPDTMEDSEEMYTPMSGSISESGSYVVQVGAWRSEDKAQSFVDQWSDRNYPSSYVVKTGDEETGDIWFRVRVGNFETRDAAKEFGASLAAEINSGYWVANKD
jgi:cell division septation protein DedD